jgi:hypothetical protein
MLVQGSGPSSTGGSISGSSGSILVPQAQVFSVDPAPDGQTTVVSVVVANWAAAAVAGSSAKGEVSIVLLGGPAG